MTMRQARLESTLHPTSRSPSPEPITHAEEQRLLRDETIAVFHSAVGDGYNAAEEDDDENDLLVLREKSKDELEKEEEQYRAFLEREVGGDLANLVTVEESTADATDEVRDEESKRMGRRKRNDSEEKGKSMQNEDQEFLLKFAFTRLSPLCLNEPILFRTVTFSIAVGSTAPRKEFRHIEKSRS